MAPFAYILIGVGAYLLASKSDKGDSNEQDISDSSGTRGTGGDHDHRASQSGAGRNRPRRVKPKAKKSILNTGDQNELQADSDVLGNQSGDNRGGESDSPSGSRETESVIETESEIENEGDQNESERNSDGSGRNNGNDVRGESSGGDESDSAETSER